MSAYNGSNNGHLHDLYYLMLRTELALGLNAGRNLPGGAKNHIRSSYVFMDL
jgi:hypothetical protein